MRTWRQVIAACAALADDLNEVLEKGSLAERLQPL
jgi:hypothetical protein